MNRIGETVVGRFAFLLAVAVSGCAGNQLSNADVEKRVQAVLAASSPDWKDVKYEPRANNVVTVVLATRIVNGETYEYSFTGSDGSGGVTIRRGTWLARYRYEKDREVEAQKLSGTLQDVEILRPSAAELAMAAIKVCP